LYKEVSFGYYLEVPQRLHHFYLLPTSGWLGKMHAKYLGGSFVLRTFLGFKESLLKTLVYLAE